MCAACLAPDLLSFAPRARDPARDSNLTVARDHVCSQAGGGLREGQANRRGHLWRRDQSDPEVDEPDCGHQEAAHEEGVALSRDGPGDAA
eukprot:5424389-Prymnesium_polylepis.1